MRYVEAPENYTFEEHYHLRRNAERLFLAGGITGTADWQSRVVSGLEDIDDLVIFNPRRADFPIDDPDAAYDQIRWEIEHFQKASMILFWFPPETLCPIALYELGRWTHPHKERWNQPTLFIGTDPDYQRRQDIQIQTSLLRPGTYVYQDLDKMIEGIRDHLGG